LQRSRHPSCCFRLQDQSDFQQSLLPRCDAALSQLAAIQMFCLLGLFPSEYPAQLANLTYQIQNPTVDVAVGGRVSWRVIGMSVAHGGNKMHQQMDFINLDSFI